MRRKEDLEKKSGTSQQKTVQGMTLSAEYQDLLHCYTQTQPSSAIPTPYTTHDSINHEKERGFGKKEWNITTKNSSRHDTKCRVSRSSSLLYNIYVTHSPDDKSSPPS
jgi:hypothetical protein